MASVPQPLGPASTDGHDRQTVIRTDNPRDEQANLMQQRTKAHYLDEKGRALGRRKTKLQ